MDVRSPFQRPLSLSEYVNISMMNKDIVQLGNNLVVADAAKSSPDAFGYFGYLIKLFKFFSASTHRWDILLKHIKIRLESWTETRWESRIRSIEPVRYQAGQVREAHLEVRETPADPVVRVQAQSLAEETGSYHFCICTAIWYEVLSKMQHGSKLIQSSSMQLDVADDLLQKARDSLMSYRNTDNCKGTV